MTAFSKAIYYYNMCNISFVTIYTPVISLHSTKYKLLNSTSKFVLIWLKIRSSFIIYAILFNNLLNREISSMISDESLTTLISDKTAKWNRSDYSSMIKL